MKSNLFVFILLVMGVLRPQMLIAKEAQASELFTQLKTLQGTWVEKDSASANFSIIFSLTAGGTVVVESWMKNDKVHSLTVYHLDGESLLATHYCPQGNQPRLKALANSKKQDIRFEFRDATNLDIENQSYQSFLGLKLMTNRKELQRSEIYTAGDKKQKSFLKLVRVSP